MDAAAKLTPKGLATRARIVASAADLILERGVGATSLDDIRLDTDTSKGQLFHYFPGGKSELVGAIASYQAGRVTAAQQPFLDTLASWADWDAWRDAVVAYYASQPHWGCPIGAITSEVAVQDEQLARELAGHLERWRQALEAGVARMLADGLLAPGTDPRALSFAILSALQGGLLLMRSQQSSEPLSAALDGVLLALRACSAAPGT
jgi:AcrR family transcriptional regulator